MLCWATGSGERKSSQGKWDGQKRPRLGSLRVPLGRRSRRWRRSWMEISVEGSGGAG